MATVDPSGMYLVSIDGGDQPCFVYDGWCGGPGPVPPPCWDCGSVGGGAGGGPNPAPPGGPGTEGPSNGGVSNPNPPTSSSGNTPFPPGSFPGGGTLGLPPGMTIQGRCHLKFYSDCGIGTVAVTSVYRALIRHTRTHQMMGNLKSSCQLVQLIGAISGLPLTSTYVRLFSIRFCPLGGTGEIVFKKVRNGAIVGAIRGGVTGAVGGEIVGAVPGALIGGGIAASTGVVKGLAQAGACHAFGASGY